MKVLLVDDEEDIRKIGRLSLEAIGKFKTHLASSAAEGIRLAASELPDVILMDMMMPVMDGLTALAELKKTPDLARIPLIFLTARVQRTEIEHYLAMGAAGVIQKPFDPMTLAAQIMQILSARSAPG